MSRAKDDLVFSANSLQTFVDCNRRFELQYLEELKWPAVESEPVLKSEQFLANGRRFHEMIQRDLLGIPVPEPSMENDPELAVWWYHYKTYAPVEKSGRLFPEKTLVGTVKGRVLVATYDLILLTDEGKAIIYDWKTWRKPRSREWVMEHLQSKVYPLLLVEEGDAINDDSSVLPEDIEMHYWYANFPEESMSFTYSRTQYESDTAYLSQLVDRIDALHEGAFALTSDLKKCTYCPFRSYCDRGIEAGPFDELEENDIDAASSFIGTLDDYEAIAF